MSAFSVPLFSFILPLVPVVQGCKASKSRLHLLAIVMVEIPMKGIRQGLPIVEMERFEDFVDPAIEALHHPVGLGMISGCEPVFDVMCLAGLVEQVFSRRCLRPYSKPICEACSVISKHVGYGEFEKANAMV